MPAANCGSMPQRLWHSSSAAKLLHNCTNHQFAGDCVFSTIRHFVQSLKNETPFETSAQDYLQNMRVEEAVYQSAKYHAVVTVL